MNTFVIVCTYFFNVLRASVSACQRVLQKWKTVKSPQSSLLRPIYSGRSYTEVWNNVADMTDRRLVLSRKLTQALGRPQGMRARCCSGPGTVRGKISPRWYGLGNIGWPRWLGNYWVPNATDFPMAIKHQRGGCGAIRATLVNNAVIGTARAPAGAKVNSENCNESKCTLMKKLTVHSFWWSTADCFSGISTSLSPLSFCTTGPSD